MTGTATKTTPAQAPTSSGASQLAHLRSLDGLRGVAVLAVVLYHFSPDVAPGGFLGVDVFFVLSGFLITSLLVNEWRRQRTISFIHFWLRRARRLLPALFLVLAVVGVYLLLMSNHVDAHFFGEDGLATLGYFANWHFFSSGQSYVERIVQGSPSPLRHTWSLAIEEQFYLVWPLVVAVIGLVARRFHRASDGARQRFRGILIGTCVVLTVASFLRMVTLFHATGDANRVYYGTDSRAFLILIGAAVGASTGGALAIRSTWARRIVVGIGSVAAVALMVTMATLEVTDEVLYDGVFGAIAVVMVLVLVAAAQPGFNPLGRVLETRPIVALGLISYGVYLWHWPITVWVTEDRVDTGGVGLFLVRAVLTLAVSIASYFLLEQPIRRGHLPRLGKLRPAVIPVVATLALVGLMLTPVLAFSSVKEVPVVPPSRASDPVTTAYAAAPRCDKSARALDELPTDQQPVVQLFGNSIATEVEDCLEKYVEARGGTFVEVVHSARAPCLMLDELRAQVANPETRPDVAVFFAADLNIEFSCPTDQRHWLIPVRAAIDIWTAAGAHVYLVPIVPNVPGTGSGLPKEGENLYVPAQTPEFTELAATNPERITVVDAGTFIRDADGVYQWRMPCLPGGERGCAKDGTIGVRWVDGFHFCTDPEWNGHYCKLDHRGGGRRVGVAIALQIRELQLTNGTTTPTS